MKKILLSVHPKWCEKILYGKKTIEARKSAPKEVPFKCYIYATKGGDNLVLRSDRYIATGRVIGEFICDKVDEWKYYYCDGVDIDDDLILETCLDREDINIYAKGKTLYGWHISNLKIYDKPRELSEFGVYEYEWFEWYGEDERVFYPLKRPPQSWQYVEEVKQ